MNEKFPVDRARVSRRSVLRAGAGLIATTGIFGAAGCAGGTEPAATQSPASPAAPPPSPTEPGPPGDTITVTLLGTGSPNPNMNRFSMATLVQAGTLNMQFDAGRGCTIRLNQIKVPLGTIRPVFLTHFHSDHLVGLTDLWMTSYIQSTYGKRSEPFLVIGPQGTKGLFAGNEDVFSTVHMGDGMHSAFEADAIIRIADEKTPEIATQVEAREFNADGVVFEQDGVKVTAFEVEHGELIKPAYGYRVDYAGRSVLISGDTKFDENLIKHGMGVDLLIHEVCDAEESVLDKLQNRAVMDHHTSSTEAGTVFSRTKPKLAAYSHIIQLTDRGSTPNVDVGQIERLTRTTYDGPLVVGEDLMRFVIGDTVTTQRWDGAKQAYQT